MHLNFWLPGPRNVFKNKFGWDNSAGHRATWGRRWTGVGVDVVECGSDFGGASSLPAWEQCEGCFSAERTWKCSEHCEHTPGVCLCLSLSLICQCTWFYACWCTSVFLCWLRLWVMLRYLFVSLLVNILELCTPACVEMKFLHSVDTVLPRQE